VALSGGRIAQKFLAAVAEQAKAQAVSFSRVHFFWSDERCVPPDDVKSNFALASELLLEPLRIPPDNVHRILGEQPPEKAVESAAAEIKRVVPSSTAGQPVLDLIFLGMGEDGHVASLFPGEAREATDSPAIYRAVMSPKPPPRRITIGFPAIAAARLVWVLASGQGKETTLRESLKVTGQTPLAQVVSQRDQTRIYTDIQVA
jgi:6-phosphogluconolactonase